MKVVEVTIAGDVDLHLQSSGSLPSCTANVSHFLAAITYGAGLETGNGLECSRVVQLFLKLS